MHTKYFTAYIKVVSTFEYKYKINDKIQIQQKLCTHI